MHSQQQHESEQAVPSQPWAAHTCLHAQQHDSHTSLACQAASVLSQPDPQCKADQTCVIAKLWSKRQLVAGSRDDVQLSERPSRDDTKVWNFLVLYAC